MSRIVGVGNLVRKLCNFFWERIHQLLHLEVFGHRIKPESNCLGQGGGKVKVDEHGDRAQRLLLPAPPMGLAGFWFH